MPTRNRPANRRLDAVTTMDIPAIRGHLGSSEYFLVTMPYGTVVKLLQFDPTVMSALPVEERHQRALSRPRVPIIAKYILDNPDYVFSAVTVSVNAADLAFTEAASPDVGHLTVPLETEWIINDGQHRVAGIEAALRVNPDLKDDLLPVMIFEDPALERCQQIFSDLNRTVRKTSASLDIAFDHRSPINQITNRVTREVPLFQTTDKERAVLGRTSESFTTLAALGAANRELRPPNIEIAVAFWTLASNLIEPWPDIAAGTLNPVDARERYISMYAICLWAVANAGRQALESDDWKAAVRRLQDVDWTKDNPDWIGLVIDQNGNVITRAPTRRAMAQYLKYEMGLAERPQPVLDVEPEEVST